VLAVEDEPVTEILQPMKSFLKHVCPRRFHGTQIARFNDGLGGTVAVFLEKLDQAVGRALIKSTAQFEL
jgi:hypothetical protein